MSKDSAILKGIKNKRLLSNKLSPAKKDLIYDLVETGQVLAYYSKAITKGKNIEIIRPRENARFSCKVNEKSRRSFTSDDRFERLEGTEIHTITQGDPIASGSVSPLGTAGDIDGIENTTKFILNFKIPIPATFPHVLNPRIDEKSRYVNSSTSKEEKPVIIAVLDTGINSKIFDQLQLRDHLWKRTNTGVTENNDDEYGFNFLESDQNIWVEGQGQDLHGTIVSLFILDKYKNENIPVKLMILKTHDKEGNGDLSTIIDAINFAQENGANIINASWGFNSYDENMAAFLRQKITKKLKEKKILLIAAAGNKINNSDNFATTILNDPSSDGLLSKNDSIDLEVALRNLDFHNFFPASLSTDDNNIFTITTIVENSENKDVSEHQNFSNKRVDFGIMSDPGRTSFSIPFMESDATNGTSKESGQEETGFFADGSSFATAIATGMIASYYYEYVESSAEKLEKTDVIQFLAEARLIDQLRELTDEIKRGRILRQEPNDIKVKMQTENRATSDKVDNNREPTFQQA